MALDLIVGALAGYKERNPAGYQRLRKELGIIGECFARSRMGQYREPEDCKALSVRVGPYGHLHYLRRVAAHLAMNKGKLPLPGDDDASEDPCIKQYADWVMNNRTMGPFDHLTMHSDCNGYYLPLNFYSPLSLPQTTGVNAEEIGPIGSTFGLLRECEYLATALQIPVQEFNILAGLPRDSRTGTGLWKKYPIESHVCACVLVACRYSIQTGAALLFA